MRKWLFGVFIFILHNCALGQNTPYFGLSKVRIVDGSRIIQAELTPLDGLPHAKLQLFYYWYSNNQIHVTQGGYSGQLLNGTYNAYDLNHNLVEQGNFKKGLKNGIWKNWDATGNLTQSHKWQSGLMLPDTSVSLWRRLPLIHKKRHVEQKDTTVKNK